MFFPWFCCDLNWWQTWEMDWFVLEDQVPCKFHTQQNFLSLRKLKKMHHTPTHCAFLLIQHEMVLNESVCLYPSVLRLKKCWSHFPCSSLGNVDGHVKLVSTKYLTGVYLSVVIVLVSSNFFMWYHIRMTWYNHWVSSLSHHRSHIKVTSVMSFLGAHAQKWQNKQK